MSAFMVDPEHINVLLNAGLSIRGRQLYWPTEADEIPGNGVQASYGYSIRMLRYDTADAIGQMLVDANAASVNTRYGEENAYIYSYRRPRYSSWTPVEILKAIDCFEYQACETADYNTSEAANFCRRLRGVMIDQLAGYSESAWEITAENSPIHRAAAARR